MHPFGHAKTMDSVTSPFCRLADDVWATPIVVGLCTDLHESDLLDTYTHPSEPSVSLCMWGLIAGINQNIFISSITPLFSIELTRSVGSSAILHCDSSHRRPSNGGDDATHYSEVGATPSQSVPLKKWAQIAQLTRLNWLCPFSAEGRIYRVRKKRESYVIYCRVT